MDATPAIEVRNLKFDLGRAVPRHWHGGRRSVTAFFDNLSVFFPVGERFFVASARAFEACATDPALRADLRAFCAQEGVHAREHVRYNEQLAAHGYPVADMERRIRAILALARRALPKRSLLAATCGLEHLTALLGHHLLSDPRLLAGADPVMADLWRWHAVEENEHKAVAFDLYRAAGGGYGERVAIMALASVIFWAKIVQQQAMFMKTDGTLYSPREWAALIGYLFVEPGGMLGLARHYLAYFKPGFHPWQLDDRPLIARWREAFAQRASYGHATGTRAA